jgi:hypothetical protein
MTIANTCSIPRRKVRCAEIIILHWGPSRGPACIASETLHARLAGNIKVAPGVTRVSQACRRGDVQTEERREGKWKRSSDRARESETHKLGAELRHFSNEINYPAAGRPLSHPVRHSVKRKSVIRDFVNIQGNGDARGAAGYKETAVRRGLRRTYEGHGERAASWVGERRSGEGCDGNGR